MSEIKKTGQQQKLFKYYMDRNLEAEANESKFFRRLNRYHFNSYNKTQALKFFKLKYPLMVGVVVSIIYDMKYRWYAALPAHH